MGQLPNPPQKVLLAFVVLGDELVALPALDIRRDRVTGWRVEIFHIDRQALLRGIISPLPNHGRADPALRLFVILDCGELPVWLEFDLHLHRGVPVST